MDANGLRRLLQAVRGRRTSVEEAERALAAGGFLRLADACVDTERQRRRGFPEVILCKGKTPEQVAAIGVGIVERHGLLLATRADAEHYAAVKARIPEAEHHRPARCITVGRRKVRRRGLVFIVSAGTGDIPVAEEARITAEMTGSRTKTAYDVGVAGVHRLAEHLADMREARCLVVAAGMEGALPSLVGGLVEAPVIAVPTSIGYGVSAGGRAALHAMLSSCVPGVGCVNIDNGFGAGYLASLINRGVRR